MKEKKLVLNIPVFTHSPICSEQDKILRPIEDLRMEFDSEPGASVWNDNSGDATLDELSRTFANLRENTNEVDDEREENMNELQGEVGEEASEPTSEIYQSKTTISELIPSTSGTGSALLSSLAPEEDPLQELSQTTYLTSPRREDPLFNGFDKSPINFKGDSLLAASAPELQSPTKKRAGKLNKLFSSARLRRNQAKENLGEDTSLVLDPLVDRIQDTESKDQFVDEPLVDGKEDGGMLSLEKEMEAPLFPLPERKRAPPQVLNTQKEVSQTNLDHIQITVKDPVKIGDLTSSYVEYTVFSSSSSFERGNYSVKRRYRDFRWLYRQLQQNNWGRIIPPPPEKQIVGNFKEEFIENRRSQMETMLVHIAQHPVLQKDEDFIMFLSSESWSQDSKLREQLTGSKASHDSNDIAEVHISELKLLGSEDAERVLKNGGLENDAQSGFIKLSFGVAPKYKEPDQFFLDKAQDATILEEQLKQLYKALELVDMERNELCSVTTEFCATIKTLADLEISKKTSELLNNFADVHERIKESNARCSLQDSLTLGIAICEHMRTLGSVKAVLNQRSKLGYYLLIVENEMNKKQNQFNKISQSTAASEKAKLLERELSILSSRLTKIKKEWQDVGETIRFEIPAYDIRKIEDFRNNIEIYLESSIETQKECIELWETFYQNNL